MEKKNKFWIYLFIVMGLLFILADSCKKKEDNNNTDQIPAPLTANEVSSITLTSAICGGSVGNASGTITARGVCWSTGQNPTISDHKTTDGSGDGIWESKLTGLTACTFYYVRAYATTSAGTGYGEQLSFTTQCLSTVTDIDGNVYPTITIGTKEWMTENLKVTKFNNGKDISLVTDSAAWSALETPGYCWYNNDEASYKNPYGGLYNYYTIKTGKLCPTGWHVSTDTNWAFLTGYLGGADVAGGRLKEIGFAHWNSPNTGATNEFGFFALPGGARSSDEGFANIGNAGYWWSFGYESGGRAFIETLSHTDAGILGSDTPMNYGYSVRCVKD